MDRQIVVLTVRDTVCTCSEAFARGSVVSLLRRSRYEVARVAYGAMRLHVLRTRCTDSQARLPHAS